ncbi:MULTISPECIES: hypothetical protein [unclassified Bradyrhizobium]|uniref:hypothetical protein n=1 Tax=unclassified Bradyrhizobium TaxID=2631580 RepID=UPI00263B5F67|nr:hypothetical protein [Bradyrhizobium sp. WYCCWR 12677]
MATEIKSFKDVIGLWPSKEALAGDINAGLPAVNKWWQRDSIPSDRWASILSTKTARSSGLTSDKLIALAAREDCPRACA